MESIRSIKAMLDSSVAESELPKLGFKEASNYIKGKLNTQPAGYAASSNSSTSEAHLYISI
jgi:hypothetical protein